MYRSPGGAGIRLDGGNTYAGTEITPYFDSLLVKVTAHGADLPSAAVRARRALAEFRVRGVATNMAFLRAVLSEPDFLAGLATTSFIDERPYLTAVSTGADRASRLLSLLADVTVNAARAAAPCTRPAHQAPAAAAGRPTARLQAAVA